MECYVVVAEYRPSEGSYDVLANFQGPFSTHPVMARALRVACAKDRRLAKMLPSTKELL